MKVFAYCALSFREATHKASGVPPMTCPPMTTDRFRPEWLAGRDLIYFDLHGLPGAPYWFEELPGPVFPERTIALTAEKIRAANLDGAVVFAANCYLADTGSPMLDALLDAGASYVIGGEGRNWANEGPDLSGASRLGYWFRLALAQTRNPLEALRMAKQMVKVGVFVDGLMDQEKQVAAGRDTLEFRAYYRKE